MDGDWPNLPERPVSEGAALDSFQNAHSLLGSYPMASVTPTIHGEQTSHSIKVISGLTTFRVVARHLAPVSYPAMPASYSQPGYYTSYSPFGQQQSQSYNEYAHELAYLSRAQNTAGDAYWENARTMSYRLIREQAGS